IRDAAGEIVELRCTADFDSTDRKVKGVIHWVSRPHALRAEVRLYDRLFAVPDPNAREFREQINPESIERIEDALLEPGLAEAGPEARYQFERLGYFCADRIDSKPGAPVFNRTVTLRDTWARLSQGGS
ncbi:MAG: hypothetical protein R3202_06695, partial [Candidatus Competibacterales bacterium]|nr:hypothetical protein [Candidatus Competibacterales bacterium]